MRQSYGDISVKSECTKKRRKQNRLCFHFHLDTIIKKKKNDKGKYKKLSYCRVVIDHAM
jgi:hypothetical protein